MGFIAFPTHPIYTQGSGSSISTDSSHADSTICRYQTPTSEVLQNATGAHFWSCLGGTLRHRKVHGSLHRFLLLCLRTQMQQEVQGHKPEAASCHILETLWGGEEAHGHRSGTAISTIIASQHYPTPQDSSMNPWISVSMGALEQIPRGHCTLKDSTWECESTSNGLKTLQQPGNANSSHPMKTKGWDQKGAVCLRSTSEFMAQIRFFSQEPQATTQFLSQYTTPGSGTIYIPLTFKYTSKIINFLIIDQIKIHILSESQCGVVDGVCLLEKGTPIFRSPI